MLKQRFEEILHEIKRKKIEKEIETKEGDSIDRIKDIIKKIGEEIIKFLLQEVDSLDLSETVKRL